MSQAKKNDNPPRKNRTEAETGSRSDGSGDREQIGRKRIGQKDDTESADDYFGMSVGADALRCAAVDGRERRIAARVGLKPVRAGPQVERHEPVAAAVEQTERSGGFEVQQRERIVRAVQLQKSAQAVQIERSDAVTATIERLQQRTLAQIELREVVAAAVEPFEPREFADLPHMRDAAVRAVHFQDALRFVARNASVVVDVEMLKAVSLECGICKSDVYTLVLVVAFVFRKAAGRKKRKREERNEAGHRPQMFTSSSESSPPSELPSS